VGITGRPGTPAACSETIPAPARGTIVIPDGPAGRRQRLIVLLVCSSSLFIVYLDSTILNVALPTIQRDLHASLPALQWVADGYLLVVASLLMLAGSTADRVGRKRVFMTGLAGFTLGSLLCSLAPDTGSLIALRMVQGIGGSMLTPISLSIVRQVFTDERERAQALGIWSGVFGVGTACGPIAGGILVATLGWRSVFWLNVPIGIAMLAAARRYVPESRAPRPRRADLPGQLIMIAFLGSLTYAIIDGPVSGWASPLVLGLFAVAVAAVGAFVAVERRRAEPLLELRFFRSPPFTGASVIAVLAFTVLAGFLFVITLYLQQVRGLSPLRAGLSLLPMTLAIPAAATVAGHLMSRRGPRVPLAASGILMATGCALLLGLSPSTPWLWLDVSLVVLGAGLGLVDPPITGTGITGMPPSQAGVASAFFSLTCQVGNVLGVAIMGTMLTEGIGARAAAGASHARALASATHAPWLLAAICGLLVAAVGYLTTSAGARGKARAVAAGRPPAESAPVMSGRAAVPRGRTTVGWAEEPTPAAAPSL
jgi:EmrB/QacA subfamily drug resistance transporter